MDFGWFALAGIVLYSCMKRLQADQVEQYKELRQKEQRGTPLTVSEQGRLLALRKSFLIERFAVREAMRGED